MTAKPISIGTPRRWSACLRARSPTG